MTTRLDALCSVNFEDALLGCPAALARVAELNPLLRAYAAIRMKQEYAAMVDMPCGFFHAALIVWEDAQALVDFCQGNGVVI